MDKSEGEKKWWQYKKMDGRGLGITAIILLLVGVYEFMDEGSINLIIASIIFALAWVNKRNKLKKLRGVEKTS